MKPFVLRLTIIVLCLSLGLFATATVRYVKTGAPGTSPYISWGNASNDLQAVINVSVSGDEIWVAAGIYKPNRRADALTVITATDRHDAFVLKNGVKIYGGFTGTEIFLSQRNSTTNVVTLSGDIGTAIVTTDNCYHVVISANNASTTTLLDGVTITGGNANATVFILNITVNTFSINPRYGGGIYKVSSAADITDCKIRRNDASFYGAGIYETLSSVSSAYSNCAISQNTSAGDGGGMYVLTSSCLYQTCSFTNNDATGNGAGIYLGGSGSPAFTSCIISSNDAAAQGGAAYLTGNGSPTFTSCTINTNTAGSDGGAIASYTSGNAAITAAVISGNTSSSTGGGLFNNTSPVSLTNCLISGNLAAAGAGIWNSAADATIINCTITGNRATAQGGGIANGSSNPTIQNCIVYGNTGVPATTNTIYNSGSTPVIQYSLIEGGYAGTGNLNANPLFVNQVAAASAPTITGDYRVQKCSPALNGGNNAYIPSGITTDLDGNNRISYGTVDMGAYEKQSITLAVPDAAGIVYVDITKTGNGNSWANAVADLSDALAAAKYNTAIQQVWVAKGTYKPKYSVVNNSLYCNITDRDNAFVLVKDVKLIGGFAGGETDTSGRNLITNETILSGDLNTAASTDNCYHILISAGNMGTALVNGFSITGGAANSTGTVSVNSISIERQNGAAIFNASSAGLLTVESCNIHDNTANVEAGGFFSRAGSVAVINNCLFISNAISGTGNGGAAIYNENSTNITISNCSFTSNTALTSTPGYGGAILNSTAVVANISNCIFTSNQANVGGAIHNNTCTVIISGCSFITNSTTSNGGAISNTQTVIGSIITDCIISGNICTVSGGGGGIYNNNAKLTIKNSNITGNQCQGNGGGIYNTGAGSDIKIYNSHIDGNSTIFVGGGINDYTGDLLLDKCTVSGNSAAATSGIYSNNSTLYLYNSLLNGNKSNNDRPALHLDGSVATIIGCTIAGNKKQTGTTGSAILLDNGSPALTLRNSIVWGNQGTIAGAPSILVSAGTASVTYSLIESGFAGTGNINTNPLFINQQAATAAPTSAGDYHLQKCSPAMNKGSNALVPAGNTKDLDSTSRISFSVVDMGAYENHYALQDAAGIVYVDNTKSGNGSSWANAAPELADALIAAKDNTAITQIWVAKGTYYPKYNAHDGSSIICPPVSRDNSFVLVNNVKVYGGFAGGETTIAGRNFAVNQTILSGDIGVANDTLDNCYHVIASAGPVGDAGLDGFTITKGNASLNLGIANINGYLNMRCYGGGLYNMTSSPTVANCIFIANTSSLGGGGIYNKTSSPTITNCNFITNNSTGSVGGAMDNESSSMPSIISCNFLGNDADFSGGAIYSNPGSAMSVMNCLFAGNHSAGGGGAIYTTASAASIINCTITGNRADLNGGGLMATGLPFPLLQNSILWGNATSGTNNIYPSTGFTGISNCLIQGGYAGTANINTNPLFVSPVAASAAPTISGDYHLQACSPAINWGDNSFVTTTVDVDANTRIKFTDVDLGSYEVQTQDATQSTWRGYNTNWNDKINWCGGYIPTAATDVTIPTGLFYYPTTALTNEVKNITLGNSTSVGVSNTGSLTINGTYSNSGSTITNNGDWIMAGNATAQTFPGALGPVAAMKNLELKNTVGVSLNRSFSITGTLTPTAGVINTNNATITLVSNAAGTARVAEVQAAASFTYTGTGKFAVERYHPARRAWRLMTSPLYGTGTIFATWQNNGVYTAGKGLLITGNPATGAVGNGLDVSPQMNFSLKTGMPISNIGNTKIPLSNNTGLGADNKGYFIFIRGDRNPVNTIITNSNATTLSSSGKLQYGPQNFPATATAGAYTLIGNPYASPVNFALLNKTNLANRFYTWDPKLNIVGGWVVVEKLGPTVPYVTDVASPGGQDSIIQSSQAVYVQTLSTGAASLGFEETNKSVTQNFGMFRPANALQNIPSIKSSLYISNADSTILADGNLAVFDNTFNDNVDAEDALKFTNINETFSLLRNGQMLAIEKKKLNPVTDTVFLKLTKTTPRNYQFDFELNQSPANGQAPFLEDAFLHNSSPLNLNGHSIIGFNISSDMASANAERFRIVFRPSAVFVNVSANTTDDNIEIKWTNSSEFDMEKYEVEVSTDGNNFTLLDTKNALVNNQLPASYNQQHLAPAAGMYYYRIKSTSLHGAVVYSNTVSVKMINCKPGILIFPNPVTNNEINFRMNDLPAGKYQYRLYNSLGQLIASGMVNQSQRFSSHSIKPSNVMISGMYKLEIDGENNKSTTIKILVQ